MRESKKIQLAIGFQTNSEFYELVNHAIWEKERKNEEIHFENLLKDSAYIRHCYFPEDFLDLIFNGIPTEEKLKIELIAHKVKGILPGVYCWGNNNIVKLDVKELFDNMNVHTIYNSYTTYSIY
jgi:hypothetical protein